MAASEERRVKRCQSHCTCRRSGPCSRPNRSSGPQSSTASPDASCMHRPHHRMSSANQHKIRLLLGVDSVLTVTELQNMCRRRCTRAAATAPRTSGDSAASCGCCSASSTTLSVSRAVERSSLAGASVSSNPGGAQCDTASSASLRWCPRAAGGWEDGGCGVGLRLGCGVGLRLGCRAKVGV